MDRVHGDADAFRVGEVDMWCDEELESPEPDTQGDTKGDAPCLLLDQAETLEKWRLPPTLYRNVQTQPRRSTVERPELVYPRVSRQNGTGARLLSTYQSHTTPSTSRVDVYESYVASEYRRVPTYSLCGDPPLLVLPESRHRWEQVSSHTLASTLHEAKRDILYTAYDNTATDALDRVDDRERVMSLYSAPFVM